MAEKEIRSSSSSSSATLPPEMVEMILSKLPSKSLLRFKTVSKSWNTIISDPVFVQNHLHSSPYNIFLCTRAWFSLFKLQGPKFHREELLKRPGGWNVMLCECNGVLLLSRRPYSEEYMLWNPSTRREMYFQYPYDYRIAHHGICYDSATDDFKVVLIGGERYAIYSCRNSSWTEKIGTEYYGCCSGIYVDGATYWVLVDDSLTEQIAYFDPKVDELKMLQKPEQLIRDDQFSLSISVACLKSNLCLSCEKSNEDETKVQIWILEKGIVEENPNWKELVMFDTFYHRENWSQPLCFVENKILFQLDRKRFVYYSPSEKTFEFVEVTETDIFTDYDHGYLDSILYRNSLYFPTHSVS